MVSCLCSVLITEWEHLGIPGLGLLSQLQGLRLSWFNQQREGPICMSSEYIFNLGSMLTERAVSRAGVTAVDVVLLLTFEKISCTI